MCFMRSARGGEQTFSFHSRDRWLAKTDLSRTMRLPVIPVLLLCLLAAAGSASAEVDTARAQPSSPSVIQTVVSLLQVLSRGLTPFRVSFG